MIPNVAIVSRPSQPTSTPGPTVPRRQLELAAEARRVARRRSIAEGVARRSRDNDRGLPNESSALLFRRARRRATRLGLVFHRAIESLWAIGGFDEALTIFREHKAELARRTSSVARPS